MWDWVKAQPPETVEGLVLQHVVIKRQSNSSRKEGRTTWFTIADLGGNLLGRVECPPQMTPAKAITDWLLARVICVACGARLLIGEDITCAPCEAKQIMDLLRLQKDLHEA